MLVVFFFFFYNLANNFIFLCNVVKISKFHIIQNYMLVKVDIFNYTLRINKKDLCQKFFYDHIIHKISLCHSLSTETTL